MLQNGDVAWKDVAGGTSQGETSCCKMVTLLGETSLAYIAEGDNAP